MSSKPPRQTQASDPKIATLRIFSGVRPGGEPGKRERSGTDPISPFLMLEVYERGADDPIVSGSLVVAGIELAILEGRWSVRTWYQGIDHNFFHMDAQRLSECENTFSLHAGESLTLVRIHDLRRCEFSDAEPRTDGEIRRIGAVSEQGWWLGFWQEDRPWAFLEQQLPAAVVAVFWQDWIRARSVPIAFGATDAVASNRLVGRNTKGPPYDDVPEALCRVRYEPDRKQRRAWQFVDEFSDDDESCALNEQAVTWSMPTRAQPRQPGASRYGDVWNRPGIGQ